MRPANILLPSPLPCNMVHELRLDIFNIVVKQFSETTENRDLSPILLNHT